MNKKMKIVGAFLLLLVGGCSGPGFYETSYRPVVDPVDAAQTYMLEKGEKPQLIETENFDGALEIFIDQGYVVVGESDFSAQMEKNKKAMGVAKEFGATHILVSAKYLYNGTKRANDFYEYYDVSREVTLNGGDYRVNYVYMPNIEMVPYLKSVPIYRQRAAYLMKRK